MLWAQFRLHCHQDPPLGPRPFSGHVPWNRQCHEECWRGGGESTDKHLPADLFNWFFTLLTHPHFTVMYFPLLDSGDGSGPDFWGECAESLEDVSSISGWLCAPAATQESLGWHPGPSTGASCALEHPHLLPRQGTLIFHNVNNE